MGGGVGDVLLRDAVIMVAPWDGVFGNRLGLPETVRTVCFCKVVGKPAFGGRLGYRGPLRVPSNHLEVGHQLPLLSWWSTSR